MTGRLSGSAAIVTGAAGGIGMAIARRLASDGAHVALVDRDAARVQAAARDIGQGACAVIGDIGSEDGVAALMEAVREAVGDADILVNNAGVAEPIVRTTEQALADWEHVIDINLRGTFLMCRAFAKQLLARRAPGAIVNIGSVAGLAGIPGSNGYGVSKAAVSHLSRNLACEWAAKGLRVNCVAPGYIDAPMAHEMFADARVDRARIEQRLPMRRLGRPDEIAAAVAYLASNDAAYITGITLPVDGGWMAYGGA